MTIPLEARLAPGDPRAVHAPTDPTDSESEPLCGPAAGLEGTVDHEHPFAKVTCSYCLPRLAALRAALDTDKGPPLPLPG
jgi:hypothetical protein